MGTESSPDERDLDTGEVRRRSEARRCESEGERWTAVADALRVARGRDGTRSVEVVRVEDLGVVGRLVHVYRRISSVPSEAIDSETYRSRCWPR
jgi:hypothetical protein